MEARGAEDVLQGVETKCDGYVKAPVRFGPRGLFRI